MDLMNLAKAFPEMTVSIRLRDLLEANEALVRKVGDEARREQARLDKQFGDHLIKKEEARLILGSPDESTMWRWENAGYLHKVKIGVKVFYRRSEIDSIIKANETN